MRQILDQLTVTKAEPIINQIIQSSEEARLVERANKNMMTEPEEVIQERRREMHRALMNWAINPHERDQLQMGIFLLFQGVHQLPNKGIILDDLKRAGQRLIDGLTSTSSDTPSYTTFQECLGLSNDTYEGFYQIGLKYYHERKLEEATSIFLALTDLNNFVVESWIALGICYEEADKNNEALYAYTMASILDLNNPLPHLYSAECYLALDLHDLAKEALELAIERMTPEQKNGYQMRIDAINKFLKVA